MTHMYGVIDGAYLNNVRRCAELNERICARNIPSSPLQPHFSSRPVSTKFDLMAVVDRHKESSVPLMNQPKHSVETVFNPGTAMAPWGCFAENINNESNLRNQFTALQKCDLSAYVPASTSDLYEISVKGRNEIQTHRGLFEEQRLASFDPNPNKKVVGHLLFNNDTRNQIKSV